MRATPSLERLATWVALAAVGVFLVWSLAEIHGLLGVIYSNSDNASAPVMAEFLPDRGSGLVTLGNYPWLEPLYLLHLTRWLPSHRVAWEIEPFVIYALTVALVGWTVARTVSRHAGLLVALAMAAPAPWVIWMLGAPNMRLLTLTHAVILAGFIVTAPGAACWGRVKQVAWATVLAVTLAPGVASDPLVVIGAVVPFLGAIALGWRLKLIDGKVSVIAAAACLLGAAGGRLLERFAEHHGVVYYHHEFPLATAERAVSNVRLLLEDIALFVHGRLGGAPGAFDLGLELVALAAMVGVPVLCVLAGRRGLALLRDQDRPPAQSLLAVYWAVAAAAVAVAFISSSAPVNITSIRYVTILWPALLTLAAIVWGRRALTWLAVLAATAAALGCLELARDDYAAGDPAAPRGREVSQLKDFVIANHLDHGYAGYWDSAAITNETDYRVRTYPVEVCGPSRDGRCQFPFHTIDTWYAPKQGVSTFYISSDSGLPEGVGPPPSRWGAPWKVAHFGHLMIYAYRFDLASVLAEGTQRPKPPRKPGRR
jgi:hypothetical protein